MFHVDRSSKSTECQALPLSPRQRARLIAVALMLGLAMLLAGCGTTLSHSELPLPSVPSGLLAQTPAPQPLVSSPDGTVEIAEALRNLRVNAELLGECRKREAETQAWMRREGLAK